MPRNESFFTRHCALQSSRQVIGPVAAEVRGGANHSSFQGTKTSFLCTIPNVWTQKSFLLTEPQRIEEVHED
jgi:hypothetical protein